MKKRIFIIFTMLLLSLCFISCKSCKKDKEVTPDIPAFDKLVSAIYDSETKLIGYNENIKMTDDDMDIYIKTTDFSIERKEQVKSSVNILEKKLSNSGINMYDETITSYTTIDNVKYVEIDGTVYENDYVMPTYYLTFVLSSEFLEEGYTLLANENNYTLKALVINNKASSLFLNKSLGSISNVEIEIVVNNNLLQSFKATYVSANGFNVEINTTYNYVA